LRLGIAAPEEPLHVIAAVLGGGAFAEANTGPAAEAVALLDAAGAGVVPVRLRRRHGRWLRIYGLKGLQ
jgi:hypothetical protein